MKWVEGIQERWCWCIRSRGKEWLSTKVCEGAGMAFGSTKPSTCKVGQKMQSCPSWLQMKCMCRDTSFCLILHGASILSVYKFNVYDRLFPV